MSAVCLAVGTENVNETIPDAKNRRGDRKRYLPLTKKEADIYEKVRHAANIMKEQTNEQTNERTTNQTDY